ncbi:hypothetical protein L0Z14_28140 [Burkholderia multivorans]|nr:hypothetical protein [Burkholderia multivorans]
MQRQGKAEKSPVTAALRRHPREVLTIVGARAAENTWFYMVVTFALSYATQQLIYRRPRCCTRSRPARCCRSSRCRCAAI